MALTVVMGPCDACSEGADFRSGGKTCKACGAEFEKLCKKCTAKPCRNCQGELVKSQDVFPNSLFYAIAKGDMDGVQHILNELPQKGANLSQLTDRDGSSLLHAACRVKDRKAALAISELMIQNGASNQMKDQSGFTALTSMVRESHYKPDVAMLLQSSKDINDNSGRTALMFAAKGGGLFGNRRGNLTVVRHLLSMGADLFLCDNSGRTALGHALKSNDTGQNEAMIEFLEHEMITQTAVAEFRRLNDSSFDSNGVLSFSPRRAKK
jgi:ankyrin repeat protein